MSDDEYLNLNVLDEEDYKLNKLIYNKSILSGKVHGSLEDPLSQLFYDIADIISPSLHYSNITPNYVTTIRTLLMLFVFPFLFINKMYKSAAIVYILSYFGDCLDGHMSRKYNLETCFGDFYDHIADVLGFVVSIYLIIMNINEENNWIIVVILVVLLLSIVQVSCQERYLKMIGINKDSYTLNSISYMCPKSIIEDDDIENTMNLTKFLGIGTYHLIMTILIWNFKYLE